MANDKGDRDAADAAPVNLGRDVSADATHAPVPAGKHATRNGGNTAGVLTRSAGASTAQVLVAPRMLLGRGREGTYVYTGDSLAVFQPKLLGLCTWKYDDYLPHRTYDRKQCMYFTKDAATLKDDLSHIGFTNQIAVKDIPDGHYARSECRLHADIHRWFKAAGALKYTPLVDDMACADLLLPKHGATQQQRRSRDQDAPDEPFERRRLVLYRAMHSALSRHRPISAAHAWQVLHSALNALVVLHANGAVHADIKPENVLVGEGNPTYVLSDYGLVTDMESVARMARESTPIGTYGFMSPLLLHDDMDNNVYDIFQDVAQCVGAPHAHPNSPPWAMQRWWEDAFSDHRKRLFRDTANMQRTAQKIDLHSLGLTILCAMTARNQATRAFASLEKDDSALAALVGRLMMLRDTDIWTSKDALLEVVNAMAANTRKPRRRRRRAHHESHTV